MPKPFYASTEAELASGAANLVAIVTPVPATYGLVAGEVTSYTTLSTNFSTLLTQAQNPVTRTSVVVENKNAAKRLLKTASVNMARTITAVSSVTNAQLLALRLNERVIPTPRPVPSEPPTLDVVSVSGRLVKVRVHDSASESRRKPFGAIGANIYSFVGAEAPTNPRDYHFEGMATRATVDILFPDSVASGATVWLSAQWVSARGQQSIGSVPISFTLQGGAVPAAA
jgi:hypothetical protein